MKKYICLRDDDTYFYTDPNDLIEGYGDFWGKIPLTLGVVPFSHGSQKLMYDLEVEPDKYKALREWERKASSENLSDYHKLHPVGDNVELINELKKQVDRGKLEIAQHGVSHRYNEYGPETTSFQIALPTIRDGKEYLSKIFNKEIVTFIPPSNTIDFTCAKYLHSIGMNLLSSGSVMFDSLLQKIVVHFKDPLYVKSFVSKSYPRPLKRIGGLYVMRSFTYNNFDKQEDIFKKVKMSLDETGFASITCHYMLLNARGYHGEHAEYRKMYQGLIERLEDIEDVCFVTASDYLKKMTSVYYNL